MAQAPELPADDPVLDSYTRALAETYVSTTYPDPVASIETYLRVSEYTSRHPKKGSSAVASALDLGRSSIREWVDNDRVPKPYRAVRTAEKQGWLPVDHGTPMFQALNTLVAWIFSGGSIAVESYTPLFAVRDQDDTDIVAHAFDVLGISYSTTRENEQGRATELRPAEHAAVLGRLLVALGAPMGEKAHEDLELPEYLEFAPYHVPREFARVYLLNRGTECHPNRITTGSRRSDDPVVLQIKEERDESYLAALTALFNRMTKSESVTRRTETIFFAESAVTEILNLGDGPSPEELLADLHRLRDTLYPDDPEQAPLVRDVIDHGKFGFSYYQSWFETHNNALVNAGLTPTRWKNIPNEILEREFRRLSAELGHAATQTEMDELGLFSSRPYRDRYGSWPAAREAALDE